MPIQIAVADLFHSTITVEDVIVFLILIVLVAAAIRYVRR